MHCSRNQPSDFDFSTCGVPPSYDGGSNAGAPRTPTATGEQLTLSSIPDCQTGVFSGLGRSDAFPGPSVFNLDQVIRWNCARSPRASVLTAKVQVWTKECGCHSLFVS